MTSRRPGPARRSPPAEAALAYAALGILVTAFLPTNAPYVYGVTLSAVLLLVGGLLWFHVVPPRSSVRRARRQAPPSRWRWSASCSR